MGTTRPPFSPLIAQERRRWAPLRRALSNEDRAAFDRMVACATQQLRVAVRLGRTLTVNEARPQAGGSRPERRSGGEGGGPRGRPRG
jgi:hypothetical protein